MMFYWKKKKQSDNSLCFVLAYQADDDGDGNLTLEEMLDHEYTFYSTVYNEDDYDLHDELW